MAHDDCSESLELDDLHRPRVFNYSDLDDDCHYLTHLEAESVQFKKKYTCGNKKKMPSKKSIFKSLKDLEQKKRRISEEIRALKKKSKIIELIDLTCDEESMKVEEPPTLDIQLTDMQTSKTQILPNSPLKKRYFNRCAESYSEQESDTSDESCQCCLKNKETLRKNIRKNYDARNMRLKANYATRPKDVSKFYDVEEIFDNFQCKVCNIELHGKISWNAHLVGRKHLKNLNSQSALQSLEPFSRKQSSCVHVECDENELLHYPTSAPGRTRIRVKEIAKLQAVAERYREQPITGLTYVTEIHLLQEVIYYCELCDTNSVPNSIMYHLTGFRHRLNFIKMTYPIMYERFQYRPKRSIENEMMKLIVDYDKMHGRGLIKVVREVDDPQFRRLPLRRRSYSPYRENCRCNCRSEEGWISSNWGIRRNNTENLRTDDLDVLDISMNDFYCKVCECHMNNRQMLEMHLRGRRHLKNKIKGPDEKPCKVRNIFCPGEKAVLMKDLQGIQEPIVGLNFIQEVQGRGGIQYKCFLCGACCTSYDIIEHIISEKHRIKLLEAENKKGNKNSIGMILNLNLPNKSRNNLIAEVAGKIERKYGKGKMLVYKSKDIYY